MYGPNEPTVLSTCHPNCRSDNTICKGSVQWEWRGVKKMALFLFKFLLLSMIGTTGQLEQPESWNDLKARTAGKPKLLEKPERPYWSLRQYTIDGMMNYASSLGNVNQICCVNFLDFADFFLFGTLLCAIRECSLSGRCSVRVPYLKKSPLTVFGQYRAETEVQF